MDREGFRGHSLYKLRRCGPINANVIRIGHLWQAELNDFLLQAAVGQTHTKKWRCFGDSGRAVSLHTQFRATQSFEKSFLHGRAK